MECYSEYLQEVLDGLADVYDRNPLGVSGVRIYESMLSGYTVEQINFAISRHQQDPQDGRFFPKPANLLKWIEGSIPTEDEIISAARLAETPLGVLCRIHIGTFDLDNAKDHFYLRARAAECLALYPEWKERAKKGEFSKHEISIMLKHKVRPSNPFYIGMAPPVCADFLNARSLEVYNSSEFKALTAPKYEEAEGDKNLEAAQNVKDFISNII